MLLLRSLKSSNYLPDSRRSRRSRISPSAKWPPRPRRRPRRSPAPARRPPIRPFCTFSPRATTRDSSLRKSLKVRTLKKHLLRQRQSTHGLLPITITLQITIREAERDLHNDGHLQHPPTRRKERGRTSLPLNFYGTKSLFNY